MPMKNGENHMKEQNKSFQMVYGMPKAVISLDRYTDMQIRKRRSDIALRR
jgi:hypothetical protein